MIARRWLAILGTGALLAAGALSAAVASADELDDADDTPDVAITGAALERASAAALAHLGEGQVTGTEAGDEEGAYEIEVTLDDGTQVDVHLDETFQVIGAEAEDAEESDD